MKKLTTLLLTALTLLSLYGCQRAPSNVYVLSTTDCGARWTQVRVSETIPKHAANPCGYNIALPNWPMAGDVNFKTQFAGNVLSKTSLSYTYAITDPIAFINNARYLSKMGANDLEISAETIGSRYEMAENILVDKLLRDETVTLTRALMVVDANPAEIENTVFANVNAKLAQRGVTLVDLTMVMENDEQTKLAIDAVTASRVYEAAGLSAVGAEIIKARAGATKIVVETAAGAATPDDK